MAKKRDGKMTRKELDKKMREAEIEDIMSRKVVEKMTVRVTKYGQAGPDIYEDIKRFSLSKEEQFLVIESDEKEDVIQSIMIPTRDIMLVDVDIKLKQFSREEAEELVDDRMKKAREQLANVTTYTA